MSLLASKSIVQLGAVNYKCWEDELIGDKTLKDNIDEFYEDYEVVVWLLFVFLVLTIAGCIACGCWVRCSMAEVNKLREEKDKIAVRKNFNNDGMVRMDESLASQTDLEKLRSDMKN